MQTIQLKKKVDQDGHLRLDVPLSCSETSLDILLVIQPMRTENKRYDFSALAGTLRWQGDSVAEQRRLRNEWD